MRFIYTLSAILFLNFSFSQCQGDANLDDINNINEITDIYIPEKNSNCEFIEGEDEYDIGRNLALKLRDNNLI